MYDFAFISDPWKRLANSQAFRFLRPERTGKKVKKTSIGFPNLKISIKPYSRVTIRVTRSGNHKNTKDRFSFQIL